MDVVKAIASLSLLAREVQIVEELDVRQNHIRFGMVLLDTKLEK